MIKNIFQKEKKNIFIFMILVLALSFLIFESINLPLLADTAGCSSGGCNCTCTGISCHCWASDGACECMCWYGDYKWCDNSGGGGTLPSPDPYPED